MFCWQRVFEAIDLVYPGLPKASIPMVRRAYNANVKLEDPYDDEISYWFRVTEFLAGYPQLPLLHWVFTYFDGCQPKPHVRKDYLIFALLAIKTGIDCLMELDERRQRGLERGAGRKSLRARNKEDRCMIEMARRDLTELFVGPTQPGDLKEGSGTAPRRQ
jgi:hypothetical protein